MPTLLNARRTLIRRRRARPKPKRQTERLYTCQRCGASQSGVRSHLHHRRRCLESKPDTDR